MRDEVSESEPAQIPEQPGHAMEELRALLLSPEHAELESLKQQLASRPAVDAPSIASVLPAAFVIASEKDEILAQALTPQIEQGLRESVRRHPDVITEAIFPIMGGAISRAVRESLAKLLEQTTYALDHAFSLRGWRWRMEALATGKSFGEVVLLHSLVYRVEQVFLIHPQSGLLLQHVISSQVEKQLGEDATDASMVTSMLTAIQDFVRDSFQVESKAALDSIEVGDLKVWLERGPHAVLACVIRGTAPAELRDLLRRTVETVHGNYLLTLKEFSGDTDALRGVRPYLEACLQAEQRPEGTRTRYSMMFAAVILVVVALAIGQAIHRERAWHHKLVSATQVLRQQPGVVLLSATQKSGHVQIHALRDPEAESEASILAQAGLSPHNSSVTFTPYLSTEPALIQKRARRILIPPSSVVLSFQETDGVLLATGMAAASWIDDAEKMARLIPGVRRFDCQVRAEKRPKSLYQVLHEKAQELESIEFRFRAGSIELLPGQEAQLERAVSTMKELVKLVETDTSGMNVTIEVHAHTDPLGSELYNLKLRESRAKMMRHWLANAGVDMRRLKAVAPLEFEQEKSERAASFRVVITGGLGTSG